MLRSEAALPSLGCPAEAPELAWGAELAVRALPPGRGGGMSAHTSVSGQPAEGPVSGVLTEALQQPEVGALPKPVLGPVCVGRFLKHLSPVHSSPLPSPHRPPCCWLPGGFWAWARAPGSLPEPPKAQISASSQPGSSNNWVSGGHPGPPNPPSCSQGWLWVSGHLHPGSSCVGAPGWPWQPPWARPGPARAVTMTYRM